MSKLYGTLVSDKSGRRVTKTGSQYIKAVAQSYEGSVSVELGFVMGVLYVTVKIANDSTACPLVERVSMPLEQFLKSF